MSSQLRPNMTGLRLIRTLSVRPRYATNTGPTVTNSDALAHRVRSIINMGLLPLFEEKACGALVDVKVNNTSLPPNLMDL